MALDTLIELRNNPEFKEYNIGRYTYAYQLTVWFHWYHPEVNLTIGNFCSIAPNVIILLGGYHRPDWVSTYPFNCFFQEFHDIKGNPYTKGGVTIGNDVWIGQEAMIMSGVTIGDGAVIGARTIVSKDVPAYAVVVGNSQRIVKMRFSDKIIAKLLEIKWWDWDFEKIKQNIRLIQSPNIEDFIAGCKQNQEV